jgi:hypothetical protein
MFRNCGVSARVDARPVAGYLGVIDGDAFQCGFGPGSRRGVFRLSGLLGHLVNRSVGTIGCEQFREPVIDAAETSMGRSTNWSTGPWWRSRSTPGGLPASAGRWRTTAWIRTSRQQSRRTTGPRAAIPSSGARLIPRDTDRSAFLAIVAARWAQLDPAEYPFVRQVATQLPEHDDRDQFLAGIDLILAGITTVR